MSAKALSVVYFEHITNYIAILVSQNNLSNGWLSKHKLNVFQDPTEKLSAKLSIQLAKLQQQNEEQKKQLEAKLQQQWLCWGSTEFVDAFAKWASNSYPLSAVAHYPGNTMSLWM